MQHILYQAYFLFLCVSQRPFLFCLLLEYLPPRCSSPVARLFCIVIVIVISAWLLFADIGPSIAGCILEIIDQVCHFFIYRRLLVLLINRNS